MFSKRLIMVAAVCTVLSLVTGCAAPATQAPTPAPASPEVITVEKTVVVQATAEAVKDPVRIGAAFSFSGPMSFIGDGSNSGTTLALEELGYEVAGHPVEIYNADNACNPEQAVSAVRSLVEVNKVDLILGSGCSSSTLAAMTLLPELSVPQIVSVSSSPKIYDDSGVGGNEWNFVHAIGAIILGDVLSGYVAERVESVAILANNDDFGRGSVSILEPSLKSRGVEVTNIEYYDIGVADARPILLKVKQANPEGFLLVAGETDAIVILRQFRELGLTQTLFGQGTIATPLFLERTKDEPGLGEGLLNIAWWAPGMDPQFDAAYEARWAKAPYPNSAMMYYVMRYIVKAAIEEADKTGKVDGQSLRDALAKISVDTPMGTLSFDEHNQAYPDIAIVTMEQGKIILKDVIHTNPNQ